MYQHQKHHKSQIFSHNQTTSIPIQEYNINANQKLIKIQKTISKPNYSNINGNHIIRTNLQIYTSKNHRAQLLTKRKRNKSYVSPRNELAG